MNNWRQQFVNEDIFFVTPDVKRGLGFAGILPKYHIICTDIDPIIPILRNQGTKIFCLEEIGGLDTGRIRNSGKLLETPQALEYIKRNSKSTPKVMYFKPSLKLDLTITKNHLMPIGNNSNLNEQFEDKINFCQLAKHNFPEYLMPSMTGIIGNLNFLELTKKFELPFVLQFGQGWAGNTTFTVKNEKEFTSLVQRFPQTNVKISKFVEGFAILNNCCIYTGKVMISDPAVQIDSIPNLCEKPEVTCGRQWPAKFINQDQIDQIRKISRIIGNMMNGNGFRGFFGIDFLIEKRSGQIYVSEINARLTASSAFFTLLEIGTESIPLMAYHLADFIGVTLGDKPEGIDIIGSQIIFRKPYSVSNLGDNLYGVFNYIIDKPIIIRKDYCPQNLNNYEYIFMGRKSLSVKPDDEFARIESKCEVLSQPGRFNSLFDRIINSYSSNSRVS